MTAHTRPLILLTNDDGIHSPGLAAAALALQELGDLLIAAPLRQHSGSGRSFPLSSTGNVHAVSLDLGGGAVEAYGIEASPAQTVVVALRDLSPRLPDLAVVGINYGENLGEGITGSGTVGAGLQAASVHIPTLAVSLQTATEFHYSHSSEIDFCAAARFTRFLVGRMLRPGFELPPDVDLLKVDVPQGTTTATPWRLTRVSRQPYFEIVRGSPEGSWGGVSLGYRVRAEWPDLEPDSDIHALAHEGVISVSPVSIDLSSRVELEGLDRLLRCGPDSASWG